MLYTILLIWVVIIVSIGWLSTFTPDMCQLVGLLLQYKHYSKALTFPCLLLANLLLAFFVIVSLTI